MLELAGLRGEKVGEEDEEEDREVDDDEVEVALWATVDPADPGPLEAGEWACDLGDRRLFASAAAAAALAALLMGTWMPSDGRESDLRRVLYGMAGDF